jgi:arsenate reductase
MVISQSLLEYIDQLDVSSIPEERKHVLGQLSNYIQSQLNAGNPINLNYICTHNSRRSQFSQVWSQFMALHFGLEDVTSVSGGVEVTACNPRTVDSLRRAGFEIPEMDGDNPVYPVSVGDDSILLTLYSKLFDEDFSLEDNYAAIMTCSHADENCPFIPNADVRIPLNYEDPKAFDDTPEESKMYDERCKQIATELKFVYSQVI